MATSRALVYLIRKRHLLPCSVSLNHPKNQFYFPFHTSQVIDQKIVAKSEQNETNNQVQVGLAEKVKENTKSAWYLSVIIAGFATTGIMFYAIFRELFSHKSPNSVYTAALDRCTNDPKVVNALGSPIKAYGEETRRGRRGHISHSMYEKNGVPHMRIKFYIQGIRERGTVHLEVKEDSNGKWIYRYLFIQLKNKPRSVIVLEDNREVENIVYNTPEDSHELMPPGYKQDVFQLR